MFLCEGPGIYVEVVRLDSWMLSGDVLTAMLLTDVSEVICFWTCPFVAKENKPTLGVLVGGLDW